VAIGALVGMAPPPAGPMIGGAMTLVGTLLPMFAGPPPPSKEMVMLE